MRLKVKPGFDELKHSCGLFGVYGNKEAARLCYLGLFSLQHRGEESAGIVTYDGKKLRTHKGMGLVGDVFKEKVLKTLKGDIGVGHVRYSTTGSSTVKNVQPFIINHKHKSITIAHNGNLTNAFLLKEDLEEGGSIFQTSMDSELIVHLIVKSKKKDSIDALIDGLSRLEGAYSLIIQMEDKLIGVRDPNGFRPLCIGKFDGAHILASETCALDLIKAEYVRDVEPGEVVIIGKDGIESRKIPSKKQHSFCIFEFIYFARPDSNIFTKNVYLTRKNLGKLLAQEHPCKADIIMPVPDSGNYATLGYAKESGLPLEMGMIRNHYVGRTFIQPLPEIRDFRVKVKLNPISDVVRNKKVLIIEDSIVRGTTCRARVKTLFEAGAKEVHMRISCPPLRFPCFYGIDFPTKQELIANQKTVEEIREFIGLNSLGYLSKEKMLESMLLPKEEFCTACFDGNYPVKPCKKIGKEILERK